MTAGPALPPGIRVLERGWLSSNNVVLVGGGAGAVLVDTGHVNHAAQTVALLRASLADEPLARIVNTHLHSDHCGGNAAVQRAFGGTPTIAVPPGHFEAARRWDEDVLSYRPTGQRCERFVPDAVLAPGSTLAVGGRTWQVLAAPGHDPHSVILFEPASGALISADALWENGFGVVFPELDGPGGFDEVGATLDLIASLPVRIVVPGHGAPFTDVEAALARARRRLAAHVADPARHARHGLKVLIKYHLLEEGTQPLPALRAWLDATPLAERCWQRAGGAGSVAAFGDALIGELLAGGALVLRDGIVHND